MKKPDASVIWIEYKIADKYRRVSMNDPSVEGINLTGPGMAEILYVNDEVEGIVSDQMVWRAKVDTSMIQVPEKNLVLAS